jgi:hypothetical protein
MLGVGLMTSSRDREVPYPIDLPRLLRVGSERRGEESQGEKDAERNFAGLHGDLPCFWRSLVPRPLPRTLPQT